MSSARLKKQSALDKRKNITSHTSVDLTPSHRSSSSLTSSTSCPSDCLVHVDNLSSSSSPSATSPSRCNVSTRQHISIQQTGASSSLPLTKSSNIFSKFTSASRSLDCTNVHSSKFVPRSSIQTSNPAQCKSNSASFSTRDSYAATVSTTTATSTTTSTACESLSYNKIISDTRPSSPKTIGLKYHKNMPRFNKCTTGASFTRAASVDSVGILSNTVVRKDSRASSRINDDDAVAAAAATAAAATRTVSTAYEDDDDDVDRKMNWLADETGDINIDDHICTDACGYSSLPSSSLQLSSSSSSPSPHHIDSGAKFIFGSLMDVTFRSKKNLHQIDKSGHTSDIGSGSGSGDFSGVNSSSLASTFTGKHSHHHSKLIQSSQLISSHESLTSPILSGRSKKSSLPCIVIHDAISPSHTSKGNTTKHSQASGQQRQSKYSTSYEQQQQQQHHTSTTGSTVSHQSSLPGLRSKFEMLTKSFSVDSAQTGSISLPQSPSPSSLLAVSPISPSSSIFSNSSSSFSSSSASSFATAVEVNRLLFW